MSHPTAPRRGRRPGRNETRQQVILAARTVFARLGYRGATIRGVAAESAVDPALILHYFKSKAGLFDAAMAPPFVPAELVGELLRGPRSQLGTRLVETLLREWEAEPARDRLLGLMRASLSEADAGETLARHLVDDLFGPLVRLLRLPTPGLAADTLAAQFAGLLYARHVLRLEHLASATATHVAMQFGASAQVILDSPPPPVDATNC